MVSEHVIEAHAAAGAGEFARRARAYDAAVNFGRSAWRAVERDDTPAAVEGFLKGTRVESWGLQMAWSYTQMLWTGVKKRAAYPPG